MKSKNYLITLFILFLISTKILAASLTADQILKKVDSLNSPKDMQSTVEMILINDNGDQDKRELEMMSKGTETRKVKYLAPADVKGIAFLVLKADTPQEKMYLYLPAFRKVRTIASHIKNQSFQGTDFSYEDMGSSKYAEKYTASLEQETELQYKLKLTPKNTDASYSKVIMFVNKKTFIPERAEMYNQKQELNKIMESKETETFGKYIIPVNIAMKDVLKNHSTVMKMKGIKFDQGLSDREFTVRNLKR